MNANKIAVITGAARGIGRATALSLAKKGISPVIVDIDYEGARLVQNEIEQMGIVSASYKVDISNVAQITRMVEDVIERFKHIDILVNNAGILSIKSIEDIDEHEWDKVMNTNVKSAMFTSQQVLKHMIRQRWGRIINISSLAGRMGGISTGCAYSASKAALIGMTMCMARRVASYNITVNAIAPGTTEGELVKGFSDTELASLAKSIPAGRLGKPEDIAEAVAFLASDEAGFINGATLDVNGGMFMG